MNTFKYIKDRFLKLTSRTYPHGTERELVDEMLKLGIFPALEKDNWGNYFIKIGESRTVFASHLDTASKSINYIKHRISKQQIITSDGTSILGADDKAGVSILLWLIENKIPGLYYFFVGEEVGCVGSGFLSASKKLEGKFDRMISFDRRGTNSVITHQSCTRTCSDEFAKSLSTELNKVKNFNYKSDDTGVYTDSAEFINQIPECTNISVGYNKEHTNFESQDLYHLVKLADACLKVDWENLPTVRDTKIKENLLMGRSYGFEDDVDMGDYYLNFKTKSKKVSSTESSFKNDSNKKGRVFFDRGGKLEPLLKKEGAYSALKENFLISDLNKLEIEILKKQNPNFSKEDLKICDILNQLL